MITTSRSGLVADASEHLMAINIASVFIHAIEYLIVSMFLIFVVGAYFLALFKHRLSDLLVWRLKRLGWLIVGIAFMLIGLGILVLIIHQVGQGVATRVSRDGSRVGVSFSSSPLMFILMIVLEMFFMWLFSLIGVVYLKLFRAMGKT